MIALKPYTTTLLLFPTCLLAENNNINLAFLGAEDLYLEDMPIVISASRLEQPLNEAPVATTVIDRQMIEASGAQSIADVMRLVPGFTVGYIAGNYPVATYHGHSERFSRRIQVVIDGRSVYLPTLAGVSWSDLVITLEDIERIEVVRGPNASTYGNNAFLAVVSITTKHAAEDQGHYAKGAVGNHDTADAYYRYGGNNGDLDYRVSLGSKNNEGTDLLDDFTETDYLNYRLDYQIDLDTSLSYQGGVQDSRYGDLLENANDVQNTIDVLTIYQNLHYEHSFDENTSISVQYYYNFTESDESSPGLFLDASSYGVDSFTIFNTLSLKSERHDIEASLYYQPIDKLRLVSGVSARVDKVGANNVFDAGADNSLNLFRFFTHGEYRLNNSFLINAGFMVEENDISGTDFNPRLGFIYHLNDQNSFRLSASTATRTPTLFDETGYFAVSQTLTQNNGQPLSEAHPLYTVLNGDRLIDLAVFSPGGVESEEITSVEFGWIFQLKEELILDMKIYRDEVSKLIAEIPQLYDVPDENIDDLNIALGFPIDSNSPGYNSDNLIGSPGAVYYDNSVESEVRGIEVSLNYNIPNNWRLYTFFTYSTVDAKKTNDVAPDSAVGKIEETIPRRALGSMLIKQWENSLSTSLAVYHVSDMDWIDRTHSRNNPIANRHTDRSAEAYTKVDFVVRKVFTNGDAEIETSLVLQNLLGTHYDYTRSSYTDSTFETIDVPGSQQDPRAYFELAIKF